MLTNPFLQFAALVAVEMVFALSRGTSDSDPTGSEKRSERGRGQAGCLAWVGLAVVLALLVWWLHSGSPIPSINVASQLEGGR